jgi:hypothetical protein
MQADIAPSLGLPNDGRRRLAGRAILIDDV